VKLHDLKLTQNKQKNTPKLISYGQKAYKADVVNENKNNSAFVSLGLSVSVCCDVPCMIEIKTIPFY